MLGLGVFFNGVLRKFDSRVLGRLGSGGCVCGFF